MAQLSSLTYAADESTGCTCTVIWELAIQMVLPVTFMDLPCANKTQQTSTAMADL